MRIFLLRLICGLVKWLKSAEGKDVDQNLIYRFKKKKPESPVLGLLSPESSQPGGPWVERPVLRTDLPFSIGYDTSRAVERHFERQDHYAYETANDR